jgi:hypothetical protein
VLSNTSITFASSDAIALLKTESAFRPLGPVKSSMKERCELEHSARTVRNTLGGSGYERRPCISNCLERSGDFAPKPPGFIALVPGLVAEGRERRNASILWRINDLCV